MRRLDLLETFLEVHRAGSITAGAAQLGLSQPAVSERLAQLETQIGEPLLIRSRNGVTPTAAGNRIAAQIGDSVERMRRVFDTSPVPSGTVRIGGASDVIASRVIPALAPITNQGAITLRFSLGLAPALLQRLQDEQLDLVVSSVRPSLAGVRYRGLIDEEFLLVGSPSLTRSVDRARLAADPAGALSRLPLVAYDDDLSIVRRYWRSEFGVRPTNPRAVIVPDLRGVLAAVVAGAGVSALPRYLADPAIANGSIELLHRSETPPVNTLHLAIPAGGTPSDATAAVIDLLIERSREWDTL
ncbi:MAG: LysR family transcriptional regulator [Microbacterium sp.]|jgi:DNA-binding transcriptional LysR family regulator|nr:LysR family transcriptional regulator [Microbacterium sp.]